MVTMRKKKRDERLGRGKREEKEKREREECKARNSNRPKWDPSGATDANH